MALSLAIASEITKRMLWPTPALDSRLLDETDDEDDGGGGGGETPPGANPNSEFIIAPFVRSFLVIKAIARRSRSRQLLWYPVAAPGRSGSRTPFLAEWR